MGKYLNNKNALELYKQEVSKPYFIDKTDMIEELLYVVNGASNCICIIRPRRFGKTMIANMLTSYFSKGYDASTMFDKLHINKFEQYKGYLNTYHVIHIDFSQIPMPCNSYNEYIVRIVHSLIEDLKTQFPDVTFSKEDTLWDILDKIYYQYCEKFIFILDEWDAVFHMKFITTEEKSQYLSFLKALLKDKAYVFFAYMTGILPIAKYSSGSELNMFLEYTMITEEKFSEYFGFTELEVDKLYEKYLTKEKKVNITRDGLRNWYNGYHTKSGNRVYNPRSVVTALINNNLGNYWTNSGPYDEIYFYVNKNVDAVRDDIATMIAGIPVRTKIREYAATSMNLTTKSEIFSAMVVYGFLSFENGDISIPNRELMDKFNEMLQKEQSLGYVYQLAKESERMLEATKMNDTTTMIQILEFAHNTELPILRYNNEESLSALVNLIYLSARDYYLVEREDKAGIGYVDYIFKPIVNNNDDCIIIELKVDNTPEEAIKQIKEKKYALKFEGMLGETKRYKGRILAVGISYDKHSKKHDCKIEILRNRL